MITELAFYKIFYNNYPMSRTLSLGKIDNANLNYHNEAENTAYSVYYHLIDEGSMTAGYPRGFYASKR
jgi:hypothetical protein